MFDSLRGRLMVVYLAMIFFGFGGLTTWAGFQMANSTYDDYGKNLQVHALQLANSLVEPLEYNSPSVGQLMATSAENLNGQVVLFDRDQQIVASTDGNSAELTTLNSYTYQNNAEGVRTVYSAVPILYEKALVGVVQIAVPATEPEAIVNQRSTELASGFAIISGLGLAITLWFVTTMTQPLSDLRDTALAMAQGDLSERVNAISKDEIGEVGSAFNEMAERVEAMVMEQRAFASNASHELRTPLTTIRLRTEALQDNPHDPELSTLYVNEIDGEVKRMGRLVDDLLLLSRLDAKRLMAGSEAIDAVRLLQILQREYGARAEAKQIDLTISMPQDEVLPVEANLSHLRVVFGNVIGNAIKYTQEGGQVSVFLHQLQNKLQLQVIDNGPGISSDDLPNIGKRFYRADKAHSREIPGTGLGLALVRSILDLYNGDFEIESQGLGHGTQVTISWPTVDLAVG